MNVYNLYRDWRLKRHIRKFGHKNVGYFNYFDKEWFEKYQPVLILLLNQPILKYWFRWILRIHKDCKFNEFIDRIEPHTYRVKLDGNEYRSDLRTHNKFSKRIYYAFRPVWLTLHILDYVIQRTVMPDFSFGFDTLTAYPMAGWNNGVGTTCDAMVTAQRLSSDGWFALVNQTTGDDYSFYDSNPEASAYYLEWEGNTYYAIARYFATFDTSALTSVATISSAYLGLYTDVATFGTYQVNYAAIYCFQSTQQYPYSVNASTYNDFGFEYYGFINHSSWLANEYTQLTFNAIGKAMVSKTGITQLCLRHAYDAEFYAPTEVNRALWVGADTSGTNKDPKLVVTYSLPAAQKQCVII